MNVLVDSSVRGARLIDVSPASQVVLTWLMNHQYGSNRYERGSG